MVSHTCEQIIWARLPKIIKIEHLCKSSFNNNADENWQKLPRQFLVELSFESWIVRYFFTKH